MDTPSAPKIVPIGEGDGEFEALSLLIRRILWERHKRFDVTVSRPKNAHGIGNLTPDGKANKFLGYARMDKASAVLLLLDADDDTACVLACELRARLANLNPPFPVAIVCADRQYESWFLESAANLAGKWGLPPDLCPPTSAVGNPKRWLTDNMPNGSPYGETTHQAGMTDALDLDIVKTGSRSFQRMLHAVEELLDAMDAGDCSVTPSGCPE